MKKEERYHTFWKYVLLVMGSILILIPLLATVFSSFKTTKDIMQHFFAFPKSMITFFFFHISLHLYFETT